MILKPMKPKIEYKEFGDKIWCITSYKEKLKYAAAMLANGTDILSSTTSVIGRDSTAVATKETNATFCTVSIQSKLKYPRYV